MAKQNLTPEQKRALRIAQKEKERQAKRVRKEKRERLYQERGVSDKPVIPR